MTAPRDPAVPARQLVEEWRRRSAREGSMGTPQNTDPLWRAIHHQVSMVYAYCAMELNGLLAVGSAERQADIENEKHENDDQASRVDGVPSDRPLGSTAFTNQPPPTLFANDDRRLAVEQVIIMFNAWNRRDIGHDLDALVNALEYLRESWSKPAASLPVSPWQPIDSAPKDGTRVLTFAHEYGHDVWGLGYWFIGTDGSKGWIAHSFWSHPGYASGSFEPTHWMPLPAPPGAALPSEKQGETTMRHVYTSTACQHLLHAVCRLSCKFCKEACRCACHAPPGAALPPQEET